MSGLSLGHHPFNFDPGDPNDCAFTLGSNEITKNGSLVLYVGSKKLGAWSDG